MGQVPRPETQGDDVPGKIDRCPSGIIHVVLLGIDILNLLVMRETGLEPATFGLENRYSTIELLSRFLLCNIY